MAMNNGNVTYEMKPYSLEACKNETHDPVSFHDFVDGEAVMQSHKKDCYTADSLCASLREAPKDPLNRMNASAEEVEKVCKVATALGNRSTPFQEAVALLTMARAVIDGTERNRLLVTAVDAPDVLEYLTPHFPELATDDPQKALAKLLLNKATTPETFVRVVARMLGYNVHNATHFYVEFQPIRTRYIRAISFIWNSPQTFLMRAQDANSSIGSAGSQDQVARSDEFLETAHCIMIVIMEGVVKRQAPVNVARWAQSLFREALNTARICWMRRKQQNRPLGQRIVDDYNLDRLQEKEYIMSGVTLPGRPAQTPAQARQQFLYPA